MEIKELRYGNYTAKINVSHGANCVELVNHRYGAHILREPDMEKGEATSYLHGMPILFPVNRISGGCFTFEGRAYRLPITEPDTGCCLHGDLHALPFAVEKISESAITCSYRSHGSYMNFPHDFTVRIKYSLDDEGMTQVTEVTNHSGQNMPTLLGFHTTFNLCFIKGAVPGDIAVRADVLDYVERNMANYMPTGRILPVDDITNAFNSGEFDPFSVKTSRHYRAAGKGLLSLYDRRHGVEVRYDNDAKFGWRLIFNGNADEFICLEPQNCAVNCPNAPYEKGFAPVPYIAPGATETYVSKISCANKKDE